MKNKELSLIFKGLSMILYNQKKIMDNLGINKNIYAGKETKELSEQFMELSAEYSEQNE